jgi:hypothetical protein
MKASIVFALFALCLLQLTARPISQQTPKARIEGSIVRDGNGDAVARARVTLNRFGRGAAPVAGSAALRGANPQLAPIPPVMTDDQGKFAIPAVDEGSYSLTIQANGYVSTNYGQHYAGGPGIPIALKAGQSLRDVSIRLTPASNISGRVRDAADQPLLNVPVQLLRYSYNAQGQRSFQQVGSARTDDHGEYRIFWMTPGRYYLMAGDPSGSNSIIAALIGLSGSNANPNNVPVSLSYAFYPGVTDIRTAQPIELQPGADLADANMTLTPRPPSFRIQGKLIDARTGMPPAQARVAASSQALGPRDSAIDQISMDLSLNSYNSTTGAFEIRDLQPGNYVITAQSDAIGPGARGAPGSTPPPGPSIGTAAVALANRDVEGLAITVIPPATLSGRVRADGALPIPLERMGLQLNAKNPSSSTTVVVIRNGTNATPATDGSFSFSGVAPGEYRVALQGSRGAPFPVAAALPGSSVTYIKEARFDGNDVLNGTIKIAGSVSSMLEVVIGVGGGQIKGVVNDRRSQPVPVAQIVLVPDRARDRVELYRTTTSDENGKFTFSGVIPGDYKAFSWEGLEQYSWFDPDLLAQSESSGKAVHVTDQSSDTIDVKFIAKEGAQ